MNPKSSAAAMAAALSLASITSSGAETPSVIRSATFIGMPAPATDEEKTDIYTKATLRVRYAGGKQQDYPLVYHELMGTTDLIKGETVGGLHDHHNAPITDANGPLASDAPDGTSLLKVPGMVSPRPGKQNPLALVTQFEYKELPPAGQTGSFWSKLPATMGVSLLDQSKATGSLAVRRYTPIDFSAINGLWIPCAASLSPWNTHLSSEEYEPDAKVRGGGIQDSDSDDATDIASFSQYYFGDPARANPYHYGLVPEVRVKSDEASVVTVHHALGRIAREVAEVMPDNRTVYMGDDGKATGLFMFVADKAKKLSSGTLYAAKWHQDSSEGGGNATLGWIKLGSASDAEIKALVDGGIEFSDIFDAKNDDPGDPSYKPVWTYTGTEWLKLKPGLKKAAAFLETRRYAAYLGATTEFNKMEGVTHDPTAGAGYNARAYVVISRVEKLMADTVGDIQLAENQGGSVYELDLKGSRKDTAGHRIHSRYVATAVQYVPELYGGWLGRDGGGSEIKDADGNRCVQNKVCGSDNIKLAPSIRTLFVGEDTARRNNNYVWAFNLETRRLSRILSVPRAAEATGLQVVEDLNGHGYIMSNFQHPGEADQMVNPGDDTLLPLLKSKWNELQRAAIGYIGTETGALPALK